MAFASSLMGNQSRLSNSRQNMFWIMCFGLCFVVLESCVLEMQQLDITIFHVDLWFSLYLARRTSPLRGGYCNELDYVSAARHHIFYVAPFSSLAFNLVLPYGHSVLWSQPAQPVVPPSSSVSSSFRRDTEGAKMLFKLIWSAPDLGYIIILGGFEFPKSPESQIFLIKVYISTYHMGNVKKCNCWVVMIASNPLPSLMAAATFHPCS